MCFPGFVSEVDVSLVDVRLDGWKLLQKCAQLQYYNLID
jgi:hypothetical protein